MIPQPAQGRLSAHDPISAWAVLVMVIDDPAHLHVGVFQGYFFLLSLPTAITLVPDQCQHHSLIVFPDILSYDHFQ